VSFNFEKYVIDENLSIKDALVKVEENHYGMVFVSSREGEITGLATDGDIRRALLKGITIEDKVSLCANRDFIWESIHTPREKLIKKLDGHIRFIPLLDESRKLKMVISKNFLPLRDESEIYIRSRAPVRVSFGGGGSDVTHFFTADSGAVINSAVSIYSHATLKVNEDKTIRIHSLDLDEALQAKDLQEALKKKGKFGLILSVLEVIKPDFGFNLFLHSDFPVGSGLGGSATITAAILGCFNMLRKDKWDQHELAEIAFQAERLHLGIEGGWQDQYAAVFGGFNFLEFGSDQNIVHPIRLNPETLLELEESLVLCDTGISHDSGNIHKDQRQEMHREDIKQLVKQNVKLTYDIRNHLLRGNLAAFGKALDKAWQLKRNLSNKISNAHLDSIYNEALKNGAIGGKLLGAGGGGFFLFYVRPFEKHNLLKYLKSKKLSIQPFTFEKEGLKTWSSRLNDQDSLFKEI